MHLANFDHLIQSILDQKRTYVSHKCDRLLATGENYGSVMLKVEVMLKNEDGKEEIVQSVAKTPPPKSWIWELFTTVVTFKKEIGFYKDVSPALRKFVREKNLPQLMDFTPKYYGSRVSLQENYTDVDEGAVLVLENLKETGYEIGDRFVGFDLQTSKLIIKNMAVLHATTIAYKQTHPKDFEETVLPHIAAKFRQGMQREAVKELVESYIDILTPLEGDIDLFREKLIKNFFGRLDNLTKPVQVNCFSTLAHNDMWTNNIMVNHQNGETTRIKFVDFQVLSYMPGSNDLVFFLYSSVELPVLKKHLNDLIDYYFEIFISTLGSLEASTSEFTKENFMDTVRSAARTQLSHILMLLGPIFTKKGKAKELTDFSPEDFKLKFENVHENLVPRLHFIVTDFLDRDWL